MATAVKTLNKHLKLAVRQLEIVRHSDLNPRLHIRTRRRNLRFIVVLDRAGIPREMKGPEIVAALKGIVNTTTLRELSSKDKADIRRLLEIINLCLFSSTYNSNA